MTKLNCPDPSGWDPFCQRVQRDLIDQFALENAVISVDRHHGRNATVDVQLFHRLEAKPAAASRHAEAGEPLQLDLDQIESIVDDLLGDCDVDFGEISFHVKSWHLEKVVFSYSKRPHESTACFFVVNA